MSTEASDRKRSGETLRCPANDERRTTTVLPPVISTEASDCERSGEDPLFFRHYERRSARHHPI